MSTLSPRDAVLVAAVGALVLFVCAVVLRSMIDVDLTRPQLLGLLTVLCALATVGVAAGIEYNASMIDYTVDQCQPLARDRFR